MGIIEQLDPISFSNYLKKYHNTICGRHPIGVLLNVSISPRDGYISADLLCNSNYRKGIITSLGGIHLPFNVSDLIFDMFYCFVFQAVAELKKTGMDMNFSFLNYAQSSQCRTWQDSSVSYAAGALTVH